MAMLIWMAITYAVIMLIAHLPILMTQKFIKYPTKRPSFWFCAKKLMKKSLLAFAACLSGMIAVGNIVQNTRLMREYFPFRLHFYFAVVNNLTFTAGLMHAVKRIYYEETYQGRDRRSVLSKHNSTTRPNAFRPKQYRTPSYWREYLNHVPNAFIIVIAGGYVHIVLAWWQHAKEQTSVMSFTVFGVVLKLILQEAARLYVLKLILQEAARLYVLKKKIRSTRIMCFLVGIPTVLIDTQSRIVLLGTQTNSFLVTGTFALAIAEVGFRAAKAAFVSIVFWWLGHPLYPVLRLEGALTMSELGVSRLHFNQVAMLGFQCFVEIFVDYVCIVMEMAAGIEFDRIEGLSTFLGALFMTMAVININISSGVYLG
ncbi:hypothetical protein GN244_ATG07430 [Phytophthora infestans]|uniref:Transmembrane protein n=1 Tax=Phytophthora infestans TaxID=4787 RepID=A0A833SWD2_PHYIN|nr:hypothetical protein GN244_ATG07430 [Phytophthora infestans]